MRAAQIRSRVNEPAGEVARSAAKGQFREKEMKSTRAAQSSIENGNLSIPAAEEIIEEALNELAYSQDPGMARALRFLAPPGYQAIVELCSENGRSKRRNRFGGYVVAGGGRGAHLF